MITMKKTLRTALLTAATPRAFDNRPGWKMDGDKIAVDGDGNPIFINAGGQEQSVKGDTITNLNAEAKQHRTAKETAEANLKKYEVNGKLIDPATAVKAIETVGKLDAKQLIDNGEVEKLKEQMKGEFTAQLTEKDAALANANTTIAGLRIDKLFDGSEFVRERVAIPGDMFRDSMAKNFKVGEDGKIEAYGRDGNRLMSKKNAGEYASGDEAFEILVDAHPQKDLILKAQQQGGTGNDGGGGQRGTGRTIKRAEFDAMDPVAQANAAGAAGKGELTIVD